MDHLALLLVVVLIAGALFLWWQTKTKGRFGLGAVGGTNCPRCGTRPPMIRRPSTTDEALWGGWTCPNCGCKLDRYGKERPAG